MRIGVIGIGQMGSGIAASLLRAGHEVTVCDVRPEATAPFAVAAGASVAPTGAALAAGVEVAVVVVLDDAQARDTVAGPDGILAGAQPGLSVLLVSTVEVPTVLALAEQAAAVGVRLIDCAVTGGVGAARDGHLVAMVGGTAADVAAVRPAIEGFCTTVAHMGPLGSGIQAKLARNLITYGMFLVAYEGQLLAEAAGVDLLQLAEVIRASDPLFGGITSLMVRDTVKPIDADRDPELVAARRMTAVLAHKDLRAALALARQLDVELPVTTMVEAGYEAVLGLPPTA